MDPGTQLDGYELLEPIGAGGMGKVYLAEDLRHGRKVAIKMLRPEISAMLGKERFEAEIQITAQLQHPHILPLFDSGEAGEFLYYVMPYIEGESLRERLDRGGRLELDEALQITDHVGAALQHAHEHGVVHRDIKPENIMLQPGQAIVADFGIALAFADAERTRFTAVGGSIGTPGYMSPEQAAGEPDIDERTDIYALGMLLYEMLTGSRAYDGDSAQQIIAKVLSGSRPTARELTEQVPSEIDEVIERAMALRPEDRFANVTDLTDMLHRQAAPAPSAGLSRTTKLIAATAAVITFVAAGTFAWQWRHAEAGRVWARMEAVPEIQRLLGEGDNFNALLLALQARAHLPEDPTIATLVGTAGHELDRIESDPPGASVFYRNYVNDAEWLELGQTPLENVLLPDQYLVLRFVLEGYRTHEQALITVSADQLNVRLASTGSEEDMVAVPASSYGLGDGPIAVGSFQMDRREITNAEFQAFVDAGAYDDLDAWTGLLGNGQIDFDPLRAAAEFVDATGRSGPAPWSLSRHREDRGEYPVRGLSWFEAAAYCAVAGKSLPTLYHWKNAAGIDPWNSMIVASNFGGGGPVPVASTGAVGQYGTADMAGNVREWVWNGDPENRYILGGAWNSPAYLFVSNEAIDPWSRADENGFRCVRYDEPPAPELMEPIAAPYFDFTGFEPVDDKTFALYAGFYRYDPLPLNASRQVVETTDDWVRERVEFDAAYAGERVPAHVFLPRNSEPPYQTVVFAPGNDAFFLESSEHISDMHWLEFLPRSGRALVFPVVEGQYERQTSGPATPITSRQQTIAMTQDIMRTVDYITERPDLDENAVSYLGLSYGAELAVPVALEKRFDALVLVGAALDPAWRGQTLEEAAPWNFVFRVTTPTILINGKQDAMHPYEEGQIPFFDAIDVPETDKRMIVSDAGHLPPFNEIIRHALDWLDERLGPVEKRAR